MLGVSIHLLDEHQEHMHPGNPYTVSETHTRNPTCAPTMAASSGHGCVDSKRSVSLLETTTHSIVTVSSNSMGRCTSMHGAYKQEKAYTPGTAGANRHPSGELTGVGVDPGGLELIRSGALHRGGAITVATVTPMGSVTISVVDARTKDTDTKPCGVAVVPLNH